VTLFVKSLALDLGLADPGLFFSVSVAATLVMRLAGGRLLGCLPRVPLLALGLAGLAASLALLDAARNPAQLLALAACLGLSLGLVLPLLQAALSLATPPHLRGAVLNLSLWAMDAGAALGPLLAGALLAHGLTLGGIYRLCGGLAAGALVWVLLAGRRKGTV
jgi:MFS family permease